MALSDPLIDTDENYKKGKLAMAKKDYAVAAENFSEALERFVERYGQLAPECGELYYQYGLSLFREVEQQEENQDIFGSSVPKEIPTGRVEGEAPEATPAPTKDSGASSRSEAIHQELSVVDREEDKAVAVADDESSEGEKNGDQADDGEGEEEGQDGNPPADAGQDAPVPDNVEDPLQLAWEVLDTARAIFEKDSDKELRLSDTLLLLGDVNLRNEMFDIAVQDYEKCLALRTGLLKPDDRMIMEVHHQIAITKLNYTDPSMAEVNRASAVQALRNAIQVCDLRLVNLNKMLSSDCVVGELDTSVELTSRGEIEEEINELEGIKVELEERIESEETVGEAPTGQAGAVSSSQAMALGGGSLQELLHQAGLGTQIGFGQQPATDTPVVVKSLGVFGKSKAKAASAGSGAEASTGKRPADGSGADGEAAKRGRVDAPLERPELVSAAATPATLSPPKADA